MFKTKPRRPGLCQSLDPGTFVGGKWTENEGGQPIPTLERLRLATFNVWFGDMAWKERQVALLSLMQKRELHVIGLQEVTPRFIEELLKVQWVREHYTLSDIWGTSLGSYGVFLLTKLPITNIFLLDLPSQMGRRLLCADLAINNSTLRVGVVHLESLRSEGIMRGLQLDSIFPILIESPQSLLMGDFNFCHTNEIEENRLPKSHIDVWPTLRDEPGWTEDTAINLMRLDYKGKEKQARYDRVLLGKDGPWMAHKIEIIGTEPVSEDNPRIFPSDHFGLFVELVSRSSR